ncbi:MAG: hypothetical protein IJB49_00530 [Clostridia bacterium]|nr:hypothetical protein [Clostridia bacterium]
MKKQNIDFIKLALPNIAILLLSLLFMFLIPEFEHQFELMVIGSVLGIWMSYEISHAFVEPKNKDEVIVIGGPINTTKSFFRKIGKLNIYRGICIFFYVISLVGNISNFFHMIYGLF